MSAEREKVATIYTAVMPLSGQILGSKVTRALCIVPNLEKMGRKSFWEINVRSGVRYYCCSRDTAQGWRSHERPVAG